mmetsp:Transcript_6936/g.28952  ORF Transcript_6936/g.28952 Transcript_6936/m.28952 type:complete len:119 (-) Transcript_6936:173-529(-)
MKKKKNTTSSSAETAAAASSTDGDDTKTSCTPKTAAAAAASSGDGKENIPGLQTTIDLDCGDATLLGLGLAGAAATAPSVTDYSLLAGGTTTTPGGGGSLARPGTTTPGVLGPGASLL